MILFDYKGLPHHDCHKSSHSWVWFSTGILFLFFSCMCSPPRDFPSPSLLGTKPRSGLRTHLLYMDTGCSPLYPAPFDTTCTASLGEINKMEMSSLHHHEGEVGIKFQQSMFAATEIDTRSLCYCKAPSCLQLCLYQKFLPLRLCQRLLNYFIFVAFEQLGVSVHIL